MPLSNCNSVPDLFPNFPIQGPSSFRSKLGPVFDADRFAPTLAQVLTFYLISQYRILGQLSWTMQLCWYLCHILTVSSARFSVVQSYEDVEGERAPEETKGNSLPAKYLVGNIIVNPFYSIF